MKKRENKKKKILLPLIVFILFFGSSIAYFTLFNTPTYTDDYSKIAINYIKNIDNKIQPIGATTYEENDICKIVAVYFSQEEGVLVCVTKDKKFVSHLFYERISKDLIENLEILNMNFGLPVDFSKELIKKNESDFYETYYLEKLGRYILASNETIVLFAKKINQTNN